MSERLTNPGARGRQVRWVAYGVTAAPGGLVRQSGTAARSLGLGRCPGRTSARLADSGASEALFARIDAGDVEIGGASRRVRGGVIAAPPEQRPAPLGAHGAVLSTPATLLAYGDDALGRGDPRGRPRAGDASPHEHTSRAIG